jgi:molybdopterin-guanine dinucleotide biosynthesis protein B
MVPPKTIAIVGYKDSGKTKVTENLIRKLVDRGLRVVTIKHTAEDVALDTPNKDTERHRRAGAQASAILHNTEAAIFYGYRFSLQEVEKKLGNADFLIIEGFKTINTHARIIVPKDKSEIKKLSVGLELAVINLYNLKPKTNIPVLTLKEIDKVVNIVEEKAYSMLPGENCGGCGYKSCLQMGKAILEGKMKALKCVFYKKEFTLKINNNDIQVNNFVSNAMKNVILGFIKTLKGGKSVKKVEVEFKIDE